MRIEINRKSCLGSLAALGLGAYVLVTAIQDRPKTYTSTHDDKQIKVEVYRDRTIVEIENQEGFALKGIDLQSDGSFEEIKVTRNLMGALQGKYGSDTASIESQTRDAIGLLDYAGFAPKVTSAP